MTANTKPTMRYVGEDGNIYAIVGRALHALRRARDKEALAAFKEEVDAAMRPGSGVDYYGVIAICLKYVDEASAVDEAEDEDEDEDE